MTKKTKRQPFYEGKTKLLFEGTELGTLIQYFKDDIVAVNNKRDVINGKGVINNRISEFIMSRLSSIGIANHFIRTLNMREQLIRRLDMLPLEVVVRNVASEKICARIGIEEGIVLPRPLIEFCFKNELLGNPLIGEEYLSVFGWADPVEIEEIKLISIRINDFLTGLFSGVGIRLVDFKLEFGRILVNDMEQIIVGDEITPDTCRLWDLTTNERLGQDRFRADLKNVEETYHDIARRLGLYPSIEIK